MMTTKGYQPFTAKEIALSLGLTDYDEPGETVTGERIAEDMIAGIVRFTNGELMVLAKSKSVSVEELVETDPSFRKYADPIKIEKRRIAANLLRRGHTPEFAAEICGLPAETLTNMVLPT